MIKDKYGTNSVTYESNCDGGVAPYLNLYGVATPTGWGCTSVGNSFFAGLEVLGGAPGLGEPPNRIANTKLLVLWGWDPTQGSFAGYSTWYMCLAREKGMKVVSIEVKYTMAVEALADQWIPIRPQTDMAMMLAVANVLFKENLYDQDYVSKFVEPTGFQKWKDYVLGVTAGPDGIIDRTPEWAAPICGVPAATIRAFAELYGTTKPTYLMFGLGAGRQSRAMNAARAAVYLQAMTGNIGVDGGSSGCIGLQFNDVDWTNFWPTVPGLFPLPGPPSTPDLFVEFKIADAILMRSDFDSGKITKDQVLPCNRKHAGQPSSQLEDALYHRRQHTWTWPRELSEDD